MMFPIFLKLGGGLNKAEGARRRMRRRKGQGRTYTPGHFALDKFGIQVVALELEKEALHNISERAGALEAINS